MDLHDVAGYFDEDPVLDGYTGTLLFYGQTSSFDASKSDGSTFRRRSLSVLPSVSLPARQVVSVYGERWVVGYGTPDGFAGEAIRRGYSMKHVTDSLAVLTPAQALAGAAGTPAWVHKMYLREGVNALTDSDYDPMWNIFIAPGESVSKGTFFRDADGKLYRARQEYLSVEGLRVALSDQLDDPLLSASIGSITYDPLEDKFTGGPTTIPAIKLDIAKLYRLRERSDEVVQAGDIGIIVATSAGAKRGSRITLAGRVWEVLTAQTEQDAVLIHARGAT